MKKKLFIAGGIVVVVIIGLVITRSILRSKNSNEKQVRTAVVEKGDIVVKVTESGTVEPLTTVEIKSDFAGEVKKLFVEEGDSVKTGDKLALVQQESSEALSLASAKASLERAKLDLEDMKRNLERKQELYQKGFIAKKDVEDAEKAYENSKIGYELAEKQLWLRLGGAETAKAQSLASKALDNIIIKAPSSGVVISLNVEEGEMITSGTRSLGGGGTTLMTIADLSKMIVKADINEVDVSKVKLGQPVNIGFDAIRGRVYQGIVKKIAPSGIIEQNVVGYPVEVEILGSASGQIQRPRAEGPPSRFGGDMFAQLTEEQRNAMRKEMQSLSQRGASREEIQNAMQKKLREFGVTPPEEPPSGAHIFRHPTEIERTGIELIKPGMTADLDIIAASAEGVLYVPKEAVIRRTGGTEVMLMKEDEQVAQPVVTGIEDDVKVEIKEGLEEGDEVVLMQGFGQGSGTGQASFRSFRPPH